MHCRGYLAVVPHSTMLCLFCPADYLAGCKGFTYSLFPFAVHQPCSVRVTVVTI
jgi:hypothetical protein